MTDQLRTDHSVAKMNAAKKLQSSESAAVTPTPADSDASATDGIKAPPSQNLTPEEQMALYEKALKEDDWGHQPC